jgi:HTH-type transcriptional regulator/antitoxin HigA
MPGVTGADFQGGNMTIQPIHPKADHAAALARIEALWDVQPGTPAHDEPKVLGVLVAAYEDVHWPILPPDPVDAITFHMG